MLIMLRYKTYFKYYYLIIMKYTIDELVNILTIIKSIKSSTSNINIEDLIDLFNTEINKQ